MTNKSAREALESIYGKGSMFRKAGCEEQIAKIKAIKGFKTYVKEKRYTLKIIRKRSKMLTYHHLRHRSEGGKTTLENGAVVNALEHEYLHSLTRDCEELINNMFRKYKLTAVTMTGGLEVIDSGELDADSIDFSDCIEIPLIDNKKSKYNRARVKQDIRKVVEEELYHDEDDDELEL